MSLLHIVKYPHPSLTTAAAPVESFDAELHTFLDDMVLTMYDAKGVGLAANQVDSLRRVTVIDVGTDEDRQLIELINPEIESSEGELVWEEGCLSFPELFEKVTRANKVTVSYSDRNGERHEISGEGLLAVALQHEIDHLDGVVFIDRVGRVTRRMALKRWAKIKKRLTEEGEL